MLSTLFIKQTAEAVHRALEAAERRGRTAVLGPVRLARALAERGHEVVCVSEKPPALRRARAAGVYGRAEKLPLADASIAAIVGGGAGARDDWEALLGEWSRTVGDGGVLVLVDREPPAELSRRALCAGLSEIQQRQAGRTIITSGLVTRL